MKEADVFRVLIRLPTEIAALSARDNLRQMGFSVSECQPVGNSDWSASATIELNDSNRTRERVESVLDILISGLDGTYVRAED